VVVFCLLPKLLFLLLLLLLLLLCQKPVVPDHYQQQQLAPRGQVSPSYLLLLLLPLRVHLHPPDSQPLPLLLLLLAKEARQPYSLLLPPLLLLLLPPLLLLLLLLLDLPLLPLLRLVSGHQQLVAASAAFPQASFSGCLTTQESDLADAHAQHRTLLALTLQAQSLSKPQQMRPSSAYR
jgi:hypothetical protein